MKFEDLTFEELHTLCEQLELLDMDFIEGMIRWADGQEVTVRVKSRTPTYLSLSISYIK